MSVTFKKESGRGDGIARASRQEGESENLCINVMMFINIHHIDC